MRRYLCFFSFVFSLFVIGHDACAFDGFEHHDMSQRSFQIAVAMALQKQATEGEGKSDRRPLDKGLVNWLVDPSYGDIVERVDYELDPNIMFVQIGLKNTYPKDNTQLNLNVFGRDAIGGSTESLARSSHNNDAHFQGQVMFGMYDWHRHALDILAGCKPVDPSSPPPPCDGLYAALVANAISDHYMEDYFAPGHIVTPRYNFPDLFATAMHDMNNYIGAVYCLDFPDALWNKLDDVLDFIEKQDGHFGFAEDDIKRLRARPKSIYLHGDDELPKNPLEELFITTVEVQSISEVLDCYRGDLACSDPEASEFKSYGWIPSTTGNNPELDASRPAACGGSEGSLMSRYGIRAPVAAIAYGHYDIVPENGSRFAPVAGASISQETLFTDETQYRTDWDIETVPFGVPGSPDFRRKNDGTYAPLTTVNFGPAFGYMHMYSSTYHASGPTARLIVAWPLIESQLSLYVRHLEYTQNTDRHEWSYGIRGDIGFSMITAFAAFGRDYGYLETGKLRAGRMLQVGVTISYPVTRIYGLETITHTISDVLSGPPYPNN